MNGNGKQSMRLDCANDGVPSFSPLTPLRAACAKRFASEKFTFGNSYFFKPTTISAPNNLPWTCRTNSVNASLWSSTHSIAKFEAVGSQHTDPCRTCDLGHRLKSNISPFCLKAIGLCGSFRAIPSGREGSLVWHPVVNQEAPICKGGSLFYQVLNNHGQNWRGVSLILNW
jgi:hypothetical protein